MKAVCVVAVCMSLGGCSGSGRDVSRIQDSEPERSPLVRQLMEAFRETNVFERGDKLAALEAALASEGRSAPELFAEFASQPAKPGWDVRRVPLAQNDVKRLNVYVPESYDPKKPTPLVMCYHPSGGDGFGMVSEVRKKLGPLVKDFILVGPDNIGPYNIDSQNSWKAETRLFLRDLRSRYNIDSDRIIAIGFSLGGYAAWSNAAYFGDEFAAGISVGATFDAAPEVPGLWEELLPNTRETPMLYAWGDKDNLQVYGIDLTTQVGSIGTFNPRITSLSASMNLPHQAALMRGRGHAFDPPVDLAAKFLKSSRAKMPTQIRRRFRTINQGRAFWFETLKAEGPQWHYNGIPIKFDPPETKENAIGRILTSLLLGFDAKRDGNVIRVDSKGIGDAVVWFSDDMIDWSKPVQIIWNGKEAWNAPLEKSTGVCLLQYYRTRDRQRLWWAGVRLSTLSPAHAVVTKEEIPGVVAGIPSSI